MYCLRGSQTSVFAVNFDLVHLVFFSFFLCIFESQIYRPTTACGTLNYQLLGQVHFQFRYFSQNSKNKLKIVKQLNLCYRIKINAKKVSSDGQDKAKSII